MNFFDSSFVWMLVGACGGLVGLLPPRLLLRTSGFLTGSGLNGFLGSTLVFFLRLKTLFTCSLAPLLVPIARKASLTVGCLPSTCLTFIRKDSLIVCRVPWSNKLYRRYKLVLLLREIAASCGDIFFCPSLLIDRVRLVVAVVMDPRLVTLSP